MRQRIVVLFHERQRDTDHSGYAVTRLYPIWRADGHEVVEAFGVAAEVPGDLLFTHVDLSEVPEPYLAFASRYPASVNGRLGNIRKTAFSRHLLGPGDPWAGPVIVKSDRNYGGIPEAALGLPRLDAQGFNAPFRNPMEYKVFSSLEEVPPAVFGCADLVVERFLPECEDGLFHVRSYFFLGAWGRCTRAGSSHPIVKDETREVGYDVPVHPAILAWRAQLGMEYGKLDYVVRDGQAILLDVNKTIGGGNSQYRAGRASTAREARARGLYALFPRTGETP